MSGKFALTIGGWVLGLIIAVIVIVVAAALLGGYMWGNGSGIRPGQGGRG
jgi:hypothetical protein